MRVITLHTNLKELQILWIRMMSKNHIIRIGLSVSCKSPLTVTQTVLVGNTHHYKIIFSDYKLYYMVFTKT